MIEEDSDEDMGVCMLEVFQCFQTINTTNQTQL